MQFSEVCTSKCVKETEVDLCVFWAVNFMDVRVRGIYTGDNAMSYMGQFGTKEIIKCDVG